jgi:gliding motility-associated-like protein
VSKLFIFLLLFILNESHVYSQISIVSDGTWKTSLISDPDATLACYNDSSWLNSASPAPDCLPSFLPPIPGVNHMWYPGEVTTAFFRKTFELNHDVSEAIARISVDNEINLFVNGNFVGNGVIGSIHTYDIKPYLRCGQNVIAMEGIEWVLGTPSCIMLRCEIDTVPGSFQECGDLFEEVTICSGDSILIDGEYVSEPGTYTHSTIDDQLCEITAITELEVADFVDIADSAFLCTGDSVWFVNTYVYEAGSYSILVDTPPCPIFYQLELIAPVPADTIKISTCADEFVEQLGIYISNDTIISETILDEATGCSVERFTTVTIDNSDLCTQFFFPNAFTPNGDGINDVFQPFLPIGYDLKEFVIFNRWGNRVHQSNQGIVAWDGTYKGVPAELGVYVWYAIFDDLSGQTRTERGNVTLIR